uniref:NAC domain-containing protein n=1 Tax=Arundo donax TaxID=35708 RepID=A0A0A9E2M2_ARUDO
MHEYRTAEPQLQQGQNGSFVLYRLFNKHEEEASTPPGSNSEDADSPSTSSPGNPQHVPGTITPEVKAENLSQPASGEMAHLFTTVDNNEPTAAQRDDPLLDVLAQLPDLQPEQKYDGFPVITSPMRPYTDHPFVGDVGGQDLSAYINSFIAHQDLEDLLLSPPLAKTDEHPTENADGNPTALFMSSNSSNNKTSPETSWAKSDSHDVLLTQGADGTGAAHCSSAIKILQLDAGGANHDTGAQTNLPYSASAYDQYQLLSGFIPEMEPPNTGALCSAGSWNPYPQHLFNSMVEPSRSDMINSDVFNGIEGWAAEPATQHFTVSDFMDPQQGNAARRIRFVHSIQRASVTEPVLTYHLESEDEAGSYYSTGSESELNSHLESEDEAGPCYNPGSSSTNLTNDYANMISKAMAGEATHVQGGELMPTQVVSSVDVTGKLRDFSFDEGISPHGKLPHGGDLKQRLNKQEHTKTNQNAHEGLHHSNRVPGEPSLRRRQPAPIGSVVRLFCLVLVVILVFVGLWKSSLCKSLNW